MVVTQLGSAAGHVLAERIRQRARAVDDAKLVLDQEQQRHCVLVSVPGSQHHLRRLCGHVRCISAALRVVPDRRRLCATVSPELGYPVPRLVLSHRPARVGGAAEPDDHWWRDWGVHGAGSGLVPTSGLLPPCLLAPAVCTGVHSCSSGGASKSRYVSVGELCPQAASLSSVVKFAMLGGTVVVAVAAGIVVVYQLWYGSLWVHPTHATPPVEPPGGPSQPLVRLGKALFPVLSLYFSAKLVLTYRSSGNSTWAYVSFALLVLEWVIGIAFCARFWLLCRGDAGANSGGARTGQKYPWLSSVLSSLSLSDVYFSWYALSEATKQRLGDSWVTAYEQKFAANRLFTCYVLLVNQLSALDATKRLSTLDLGQQVRGWW